MSEDNLHRQFDGASGLGGAHAEVAGGLERRPGAEAQLEHGAETPEQLNQAQYEAKIQDLDQRNDSIMRDIKASFAELDRLRTPEAHHESPHGFWGEVGAYLKHVGDAIGGLFKSLFGVEDPKFASGDPQIRAIEERTGFDYKTLKDLSDQRQSLLKAYNEYSRHEEQQATELQQSLKAEQQSLKAEQQSLRGEQQAHAADQKASGEVIDKLKTQNDQAEKSHAAADAVQSQKLALLETQVQMLQAAILTHVDGQIRRAESADARQSAPDDRRSESAPHTPEIPQGAGRTDQPSPTEVSAEPPGPPEAAPEPTAQPEPSRSSLDSPAVGMGTAPDAQASHTEIPRTDGDGEVAPELTPMASEANEAVRQGWVGDEQRVDMREDGFSLPASPGGRVEGVNGETLASLEARLGQGDQVLAWVPASLVEESADQPGLADPRATEILVRIEAHASEPEFGTRAVSYTVTEVTTGNEKQVDVDHLRDAWPVEGGSVIYLSAPLQNQSPAGSLP